MKQLTALSDHLLSLDLFDPDSFDSWAEDAKIIQRGKQLSRAGTFGASRSLVLYRQAYSGVFSIERYPFTRYPAELLFAQVMAWLMASDLDRQENAVPEIDIEILDDLTADIQIVIDFIEDVEVIPDPAGTIVINGENYALTDADLWVADSGDVVT